MDAKKLHQWINRRVSVRLGDFFILMEVKNAKESYGKLRLLVRPIHGEGEAWVEESKIISIIPDIHVDVRNSIK